MTAIATTITTLTRSIVPGAAGLLLLAAGLLLPTGCASAGDNDVPSEILATVGRADFVEHCAPCHGMSGRGNGPAASSLKKPPADLTRIAERHGGRFPTGEISKFIDGRNEIPAHGSREMPIWGREFTARMGNDDIGDELVRGRHLILVEYLETIQR